MELYTKLKDGDSCEREGDINMSKEKGHQMIEEKAKGELLKPRFKFKIWRTNMLTENQTCQSYCSISFRQFDLLLLNRLLCMTHAL